MPTVYVWGVYWGSYTWLEFSLGVATDHRHFYYSATVVWFLCVFQTTSCWLASIMSFEKVDVGSWNVCNNLSVCYAHEGKTGIDESVQPLTEELQSSLSPCLGGASNLHTELRSRALHQPSMNSYPLFLLLRPQSVHCSWSTQTSSLWSGVNYSPLSTCVLFEFSEIESKHLSGASFINGFSVLFCVFFPVCPKWSWNIYKWLCFCFSKVHTREENVYFTYLYSLWRKVLLLCILL